MELSTEGDAHSEQVWDRADILLSNCSRKAVGFGCPLVWRTRNTISCGVAARRKIFDQPSQTLQRYVVESKRHALRMALQHQCRMPQGKKSVSAARAAMVHWSFDDGVQRGYEHP